MRSGDIGYVQVRGLKPDTEYRFRVETSGGQALDDGVVGVFRTARIGIGMDPYTLYGRLVDSRGESLSGMLVLMKLTGSSGGEESGYISTISDASGFWLLNLANLKLTSTGEPFEWREGDQVELAVLGRGVSSRYRAVVEAGSPHNIASDLETVVADQDSRKEPAAVSLPKAYSLSQNFPNPFNPSTTVQYTVPGHEGQVYVRLQVYSLRGALVRTLVDEVREPGSYSVQWQGRDNVGRPVASGVYFYRLSTPKFKATRKMVLLK